MEYIEQHQLTPMLNAAINGCAKEAPSEPYSFLIAALLKEAAAKGVETELEGKLKSIQVTLQQELKQHAATQAELEALKKKETLPLPAKEGGGTGRHSSEEAALSESEALLPSAALCALLELHPGKQHQPLASRDLLALLLDAGHLQLAAAQRGACAAQASNPGPIWTCLPLRAA